MPRRVIPALVLGTLSLLPQAATAVPPDAAAFDILYYVTDEDAKRGRQMTQQDLQGFINQARCECNQQVSVRITLRPPMMGGEPYDMSQIRTYVGNQCALGQTGLNTQSEPCGLLLDAFPIDYQNAINDVFAPLWVSTGVIPGTEQLIAGNAMPARDCSSGQGSGGIWVCVEDGGQDQCQVEEFIIQGTQNLNVPMSDMGSEAQGLTFDFTPPVSPPTGFEISPGDEAVVIEWDLVTTGDINGYRVLCADANGNPLPNKGIGRPNITSENNGTLYFTQENLCPDGPFTDLPQLPDNPLPPVDPGPGTTTGGATTGGSGGSGGTGAAGFGNEPVDWYSMHTGSGGTGASSGTGSGTGTGTGTGTGSGGTTGGTTGGMPDSPILDMDWAYVCSDHLPFNSSRARVGGLENGVEYQIVVVAYDFAGNAIPASGVLTATPQKTNGFWDQCEAQGDACGPGGFCNCRADPQPAGLWWMLALMAGCCRRRRTR